MIGVLEVGESIAWSLALSPRAKMMLPARVVLLRLLLPKKMGELPLDALLDELTPDVHPRSSNGRNKEEEVARIHRITEQLLRERKLLGTTCLYRSLIRYVLLRQAGIDVTFVMGVRRRGTELVGHAWLEAEEKPFMEELKDEYARTFSHPRARA